MNRPSQPPPKRSFNPPKRSFNPASAGTDVYVSRLTDFERSFDKHGLNLTVDIAVEGRTVRQLMCHLTNSEALRLAALLTSEVAHDLQKWPNGYGDAERAVWRDVGGIG